MYTMKAIIYLYFTKMRIMRCSGCKTKYKPHNEKKQESKHL